MELANDNPLINLLDNLNLEDGEGLLATIARIDQTEGLEPSLSRACEAIGLQLGSADTKQKVMVLFSYTTIRTILKEVIGIASEPSDKSGKKASDNEWCLLPSQLLSFLDDPL